MEHVLSVSQTQAPVLGKSISRSLSASASQTVRLGEGPVPRPGRITSVLSSGSMSSSVGPALDIEGAAA